MNKTIEIKKRASEEVACWRVNAGEVTPNTVIAPGIGITVLIKVEGKTKILMKSATLYSLVNPGKKNKLIGGNKPYEKCEIYAIDQSSEFNAEWGLAGSSAIPCYDKELDVDCSAVAYGNYYYKIENFLNFTNVVPFNKDGEITRDDIREFLRAETTGIIKARLSAALGKNDIKKCQSELAAYSNEILEEINKRLGMKGITVYNFVISKISYDVEHERVREKMNKVKTDVYINSIVVKGKKDDISVEEEAVKKVQIPLINALNGVKDGQKKSGGDDVEYIICPRCGEKNANVNYCGKCGEKLNK